MLVAAGHWRTKSQISAKTNEKFYCDIYLTVQIYATFAVVVRFSVILFMQHVIFR